MHLGSNALADPAMLADPRDRAVRRNLPPATALNDAVVVHEQPLDTRRRCETDATPARIPRREVVLREDLAGEDLDGLRRPRNPAALITAATLDAGRRSAHRAWGRRL